jgi:hypothetical protein
MLEEEKEHFVFFYDWLKEKKIMTNFLFYKYPWRYYEHNILFVQKRSYGRLSSLSITLIRILDGKLVRIKDTGKYYLSFLKNQVLDNILIS